MKYFFALIAFSVLSCTFETSDCCGNVDTGLEFSVRDSLGNDLLDPENPNAFKEQFIKIYYVEDNVAVYQNSGYGKFNMDKREDLDKYVIRVGVDAGKKMTTTLVKWNNTDTDTLRCEIERKSNSTVIKKFWFNEELKWDGTGLKYFEIVK